MKITLDRTSFLNELLFVDNLIVNKTVNEQYGLVHVFNKDGKMKLLSTNNGLAYSESVITTDIVDEVSFSLTPNKLITVLRSFASPQFNLTVSAGKVIASSGKSKYTFKTQNAVDIFVEPEGVSSLSDCNYLLFKKAVDIANDFTRASNSSAYTLTMFEMSLTPTHIQTRATDGNKMVHSSFEDVKDDRNMTVNIDRDYVYVLDGLNQSERMKIHKYQNSTVFTSGDRRVKIMSKVGNLPDTNAVMNKCMVANEKFHIIEKDALMEPVKLLNSILDAKIKKMTLHFQDGSIKISSEDHEQEIPSKGTDTGKFTLNGQHLIDILKNGDKELKFNFSQTTDFAVYVTDKNSKFLVGKTA